jgi:RsiW-degrading membrane proteinase PrsW (M82 family)
MSGQERQNEGANAGAVQGGRRVGWGTFLRGVFLPAAAVILAVNLFGYFQAAPPKDKLAKALIAGNHRAALPLYQSLIAEDFYRVDYHRGYLHCHYTLAGQTRRNGAQSLDPARQEYRAHTVSQESAVADIGWYGLGFLASLQDDYPAALEAFGRVRNRDLPYLNNSLGYVFLQLDDRERAKAAFYREIELDGFRAGPYANLAQLYYLEEDFAALEQMIADATVRPYVPGQIRRISAMKTGRLWGYLVDSMRIDYVTVCGLVAAAVVLALWFQYLRGLDVFEPEPLRALLLTLGLGAGFSTLCVVWYDIFDVALGLRLGDGVWRDLLYCVAGIGLVEETLKIIPFLLMLRVSRQVNESLDYILYAGMSALGFAFMENLIYFQDPGLGSIVSRTFSAVLMHLSLTVFAAYGLFYAKYRMQGRGRGLYFGLTFATACLVHGLYDFWLLAEGLAGPFKLLSLAILLGCVQVLSIMIKNGLNQSEFNHDLKERIEHRTQYLVYFLSAVFLLQYVLLAVRCGADNANLGIAQSAAFLYIPLLVVFGNLGTIRIQKARWIPLFGRPQ